MQCPFDATTLQVVNRSGIEIDWCPSCKGVWLERGELDKLIEQASAAMLPPPMPVGARAAAAPDARRDWDDDDDDFDDRRRDASGRPRKRKNMLSELFDF